MIINTPKILISLFLFSIIIFFLFSFFASVGGPDVEMEVVIESGSGASKISHQLKNAGLIRSRYLFLMYTVFFSDDKKLKAGTYSLSSSMNIPEIIKVISRGLTGDDDVAVTIPEGFNSWEIDKRLTEIGLLEEGEFLLEAKGLEGYLFPDTYRFSKDSSAEDIVKKMRDNFENRLKQEGISVSEDKLIMASILEKEVKSLEDMKIVSGVLWKRKSAVMLLQVDATIAYGICLQQQKPACDVGQVPIRINLDKDTPYNTYVRLGLPAGPISNPGLNAIKASLDPTPSDYWYYLSATAEDSRTIFSKTDQEHQQNRFKYLK